jgi:hypothetical protein
MAHAWELLLLLALAVLARPAAAQLDTCDGAVAKLKELQPTCACTQCGSYCNSYPCSKTCDAACAAATSSIDDATLSQMKTGFTACGALPDGDWRKVYGYMATEWGGYSAISDTTMQCGLPASTVKLTPPAALDTCDGAAVRVDIVFG